ncbi:olfactory receptor 4S1-like [Esox lucius]|uniref:olfactory receptor 4S1-like n=1 Tax=Esox lucius TaxID=8010 RepID=UPI000661BB1A|nr:olfactory receptor 4S1-like [Esox lucius]
MASLFNSSQEIVFVLHGLNVTQTNRHIYFVFILILYLFTIFINLTLIFAIFLEKMFQNPMYLFLCNLCINGIIGASSFYPKILFDILSDSHVITYIGCLTQVFVTFFYIYCEFTNLSVMAYDRYVAICKPLHYHCIMTIRKVWTLIFLTWIFSWLECSLGIVLLARLPLCGVDIDKLYCANWAVVKLSCVDTTLNNVYGLILTFSHFFQTIFILISYVNIVKVALLSRAERRKFMQTCLPHLITLANFEMSLFFDVMYARYGSNTSLLALRNIMAVEFLVVPPLVNPIIYGMNLSHIRKRVGQMFKCKFAVRR